MRYLIIVLLLFIFNSCSNLFYVAETNVFNILERDVEKPESTIWKIEGNYITTDKDIYGTFSNSATENSLLKVYIYIQDKDVDIKLFEYGRNLPVKNIDMDYSAKITNENYEFLNKNYEYVSLNNSSNILDMSKSDVYTFVDVLIAGGICELYIKNEYFSEYFFNLDASGFDYVYKEFLKDNKKSFLDKLLFN